MDAAWPALERRAVGGWILRAAAGVTQRANSIWPRESAHHSVEDLSALLREARSWYRSRRLPVIFQLFDDAPAAALHHLLDAEGFTRQSETLVMTRGATQIPSADARPGTPAVELSPEPSEEWLQVWWRVDGRGGSEGLATARGILLGCPSVYALVRNGDGRAAAVGRLALPTGANQGGLYCMATLPEARRRGYAAAILESLLQAGSDRGVAGFWLLVTAANQGAQDLYASAGFRETGRYLYRQERLRRAPGGC
ncbi:GNAT family N-acetyltransferase [Pseudarthrobacter defluvii]|uniref:GNAT family N-acetyltransferase n=1 Tax=Pseudarthrobacter defluvii TaxID=410837 RepID=UPI0027D77736|nr:GNAT family N-acetyltransferase [Pseudarthrobacter defluvii]